MDATVLIADSDWNRRAALRRFFWESGFLVATAANARECLGRLMAIEPDVLLVAIELPGNIDAVFARLSQERAVGKRRSVLVIGNASPESLSARAMVPVCNCFTWPVPADDLLDRAGLELALRLLRSGEEFESRGRTHSRPRSVTSEARTEARTGPRWPSQEVDARRVPRALGRGLARRL